LIGRDEVIGFASLLNVATVLANSVCDSLESETVML